MLLCESCAYLCLLDLFLAGLSLVAASVSSRFFSPGLLPLFDFSFDLLLLSDYLFVFCDLAVELFVSEFDGGRQEPVLRVLKVPGWIERRLLLELNPHAVVAGSEFKPML